MFVAGIDGRRGGWVSFKIDLASLSTLVELINLPSIVRNKTDDLATLAIDIPIGWLDRLLPKISVLPTILTTTGVLRNCYARGAEGAG